MCREVCINFYKSGYIYWKTDADSIADFIWRFESIADKHGINIDNLCIGSIELRDTDGNVLERMEYESKF